MAPTDVSMGGHTTIGSEWTLNTTAGSEWDMRLTVGTPVVLVLAGTEYQGTVEWVKRGSNGAD